MDEAMVVSEDGDTSIDALPSELLDYIFTFLDIRERICTELVCKRWRTLGKFFTWSEPRRIIFDPHKRNLEPMKGQWSLTNITLDALLSRCGPSVRHIGIIKCHCPKYNQRYSVTITDEALTLIAKHCPNLEKIKLKNLNLTQNSLEELASGCRKLKCVHLKKFGDSDEGFTSFYGLCKNLEELKMEPNHDKVPVLNFDLHNDRVYGEGFDAINPGLKVLNLIGCDNLRQAILQNLWARCYCLEELRLTICYPETVRKDLLLNVLQHFSNTLKILDLFLHLKPFNWCEALKSLHKLEELHLYTKVMVLQCPCSTRKICFSRISPRLRKLNVMSNFTSNSCDVDYVLTQIFSKCNTLEELLLERCCLDLTTINEISKYNSLLRVLDFSRCKTTHFNWCRFMSAFENLVKLRLDLCNDVNDQVMQVIGRECVKLEVLHLCSSDITDEGLISLAALPNLVILDISDCDRITGLGLEVLAAHGKLEELYAATCTDAPMNISDENCNALAMFCPNFRRLDVSDVLGTSQITDNLVTVFNDSYEEGFLKNRIELVVGGTAVSEDAQTCSQIDVIFNFYFHSFFNSPTIYPHAQGRFASFPTF